MKDRHGVRHPNDETEASQRHRLRDRRRDVSAVISQTELLQRLRNCLCRHPDGPRVPVDDDADLSSAVERDVRAVTQAARHRWLHGVVRTDSNVRALQRTADCAGECVDGARLTIDGEVDGLVESGVSRCTPAEGGEDERVKDEGCGLAQARAWTGKGTVSVTSVHDAPMLATSGHRETSYGGHDEPATPQVALETRCRDPDRLSDPGLPRPRLTDTGP